MSKVLKLDRIATYVSPATDNTVIGRGQTIRVSDASAQYLLKGAEVGDNQTPIPHFIEVDDRYGDYVVDIDIEAQIAARADQVIAAKNMPPIAPAPLRRERTMIEDADDAVEEEVEEVAPRRTTSQRRAATVPAPVAAKKSAPRRRLVSA